MSAHTTQNLDGEQREPFSYLHATQSATRLNEKHTPKERDSASGGGHHGAVVSNHVLGRDVVLQEQALRILLLQSVPLSHVLPEETTNISFSQQSDISQCSNLD